MIASLIRRRSGFSLIEVLVVLVVLGALVAVASASFIGHQRHADDVAAQAPLEDTRKLLVSYAAAHDYRLGDDTQTLVDRLNADYGDQIAYRNSGVVDQHAKPLTVTVDLDDAKDYVTFCAASRTGRVYCMRYQPRGRLQRGSELTAARDRAGAPWLMGLHVAGVAHAASNSVVSRCTGRGEPIADAQAAAVACLADADLAETPTELNAARAEPGFHTDPIDTPPPEQPFTQEPDDDGAPPPTITDPADDPAPEPPADEPVDDPPVISDGDGDGTGVDTDPDDSNPCTPNLRAPTCPQPDTDSDDVADPDDSDVVNPCDPDPTARACNGFLAYLYFSDFEAFDPALYDRSAQDWARAHCQDRYWDRRSSSCQEMDFSGHDKVNGPLHTNDQVNVCGRPTFGRFAADRIQIASGGYKQTCSPSSAEPKFHGTLVSPAPRVALPTVNARLYDAAEREGSVFYGKTTVVLDGPSNSMTVTNDGQTTTQPMPANGVLYVRNDGDCDGEDPTDADYDEPERCGNVYVTGSYSRSLTIAAENDIIIRPSQGSANGDLIAKHDAVLGLVANHYVRVFHPVRRSRWSCSNDRSQPMANNIRIDAAILALEHSFVVDNYDCGDPLGTLSVRGAIAQKYRGPVGTGSGTTITTGFAKNYTFDERLRTHSPPFFLAPDPS